jgi:murein tripeptide amidase MpaA
MGTHHAREWPSAEHSLEWAYDLLTNYGNQSRTTRLVRAKRNIVIPVVNPDGFNISRGTGLPAGDRVRPELLRDEA